MDKRKEPRVAIYRPAQASIYSGDSPSSTFPHKKIRPVITNISYNGLGLLNFPELRLKDLEELIKGNHFLKISFSLPPSINKIEVDCILRWSSTIDLTDFSYTRIGVEYLLKTQELFREIENYTKSPSPGSLIHKNQRFFPRIHSNIPIKLSLPSTGFISAFFKKSYSAVIKNISATGMLIRVDESLNSSTIEAIRRSTSRLTVSFYITPIKRKFHLLLRPIHIQVSKKHSLIGLKIVKIAPIEQALILEYVAVRKALFLKSELQE